MVLWRNKGRACVLIRPAWTAITTNGNIARQVALQSLQKVELVPTFCDVSCNLCRYVSYSWGTCYTIILCGCNAVAATFFPNEHKVVVLCVGRVNYKPKAKTKGGKLPNVRIIADVSTESPSSERMRKQIGVTYSFSEAMSIFM